MASNPAADRGASPHRVLLVCHAGASLGIGHLSRMLALASQLTADGRASIRMLVQGEPVVRHDLDGIDHSFIPLEADLCSAIGEACSEVTDVVVFDLHPSLIPDVFDGFLADLRGRGIRLVGIDALLPLCESLDVTWVPSLLVDQGALARCPGSIEYGWDSFLIGKTAELPARERRRRVTVLTGGSDVTHQHETLPAALDAALPMGAEVHWIQGPFGGTPVVPDRSRLPWTVHAAPAGIGRLLVDTDYAITVFGVTLFELLAHGVPTVVFSPYRDRVFPELDEVAAAGAAIVAAGPGAAVTELVALMDDPDRADQMATIARSKMAVNGARRLAELIHSLVE